MEKDEEKGKKKEHIFINVVSAFFLQSPDYMFI
jgi:hypothetical protein